MDRLLALGHEVRILDTLDPRVHPRGLPSYVPRKAEFVRGDAADRADLDRALAGVEVVFHQAAYQDYMPDYSRFFATNVGSTALLYELIQERGYPVRKVIVASSQAVYGEGQYLCPEHGVVQPPARSAEQMARGEWEIACPTCRAPMTPHRLEEIYANPYNPYALSKYSEELVALRLGRRIGVPTVALRYSITQGARQSLYNQYSGVCRIFTLRLLSGEPPIVFEDGRQERDYVHVDDVVDANLLVLSREDADGEAFNVGGDRAVTVLDYARALAERIGKRIAPSLTGEYRVGDNRHSVSSVEKLQRLGWRPKKGLSEILDDYLGWVRSLGEIDPALFAAADRAMRDKAVIRRAKAGG